MRLITEWSGELERMLAKQASASQLAELLAQVHAQGDIQINLLAQMCREPMKLLTVEHARQWPEASAASLAAFTRHVLLPQSGAHPPCTPRDRFVAEALSDGAVSKPLRIALWQMMVMDDMIIPCHGGNQWDGEWEVQEALSDHRAVRGWRCLTKQAGWMDLCCSDAFRFGARPKFPDAEAKRVEEAILKDSPVDLIMPLDVAGRGLSKGIVNLVMAKQAVQIATYLYQNNARFAKEFSPRRLLFYVCSNWNRAEAVPFVEMLEADHQGLVAGSVDAYGHDPLWYTLYWVDEHRRGSRKRSPLARRLIELGCNPKWRNPQGLCFYDLTENEPQ